MPDTPTIAAPQLVNVQIEEYPWANQFNHEPKRRRKLLLRKPELSKLAKLTAREVQAMALRYLVPGREVEIVVLPEGAAVP